MTSSSKRPTALLALCACLSALLPVQAQTSTPPATDPVSPSVEPKSDTGPAEKAQNLPPVVVTGNPLRNTLQDAWATRLGGDELAARRGNSLAATLDGLPGVAASAFGPQASRPILRGLDGDRLRILANGGSAFDAASLSPDHAVALDPLVIESVEILRGPAALLYGGNALGGVINSLDNRVPKEARGGHSGAVETRWGGAASQRQVAGVWDFAPERGQSGWAWHADASRRLSENQRSPLFVAEGESAREVRNSAGSQRAAAVGAGWVGPAGFAGLSLDDFHAGYGVTAEPDVRIAMQRQRLGHEGEWRIAEGWLQALRWQAARTRYAHDEIEGSGEVGTHFALRGSDARLELTHRPMAGLSGAFGAQWESQAFEALGDEAFVPSTRTRQQGLFVFEQWQQGAWTLGAGARKERVQQSSAGDAPDAEEPRFGAAQSRRFAPRSLALQGRWQAAPGWSLQAQWSDSQRAPTHYELFANGLHLATAAFERGDPHLGLERAKGQELALVYAQGGSSFQFNLHRQRFANYLLLRATGEEVEAEHHHGEEGGAEEVEAHVPVYAFEGVPARLWGYEVQASHRWTLGGWAWQLTGSLDRVRGERAGGEPLPRLAPQRLSLGLQLRQGDWTLRVDARHAKAQTRVAADDRATPGYRWLDVSLSQGFKLGGLDGLWELKLQNLGNALAYNASTLATVRDLAPLPGRNAQLRLGLIF
ncbi:iron complex outermembrane receptor protein [Inhella inkyongensis]|uniref:Iron complex outermembrane receptor protein n=1 Tax=Inhella inkyongensis TaxID=392593 RepID=A0A840S5A7_9BURK|nr:TonB-dependent receptor [Inhella inkyongensis]MBB5204206.1 iron complex outermembrane receptor protein [Inhella inkyongensis]